MVGIQRSSGASSTAREREEPVPQCYTTYSCHVGKTCRGWKNSSRIPQVLSVRYFSNGYLLEYQCGEVARSARYSWIPTGAEVSTTLRRSASFGARGLVIEVPRTWRGGSKIERCAIRYIRAQHRNKYVIRGGHPSLSQMHSNRDNYK